MWPIICGIIASLVLLAVWYRRRPNRMSKALSQSSPAVRKFLIVDKNWPQGWEIYQFVVKLPDEVRHRKGEVVCKVGIHFRLDRHQATRALDSLETAVRNSLGDKTFSIVKARPEVSKKTRK